MWCITRGTELNKWNSKRHVFNTWKETKEEIKRWFENNVEVNVYYNGVLFATGDPWLGCFTVDKTHKKIVSASKKFQKNY